MLTSGECADERFIAAFWPSVGTNPLVRRLVDLPYGLGFPIYCLAYVAKTLDPRGPVRYLLTTHRLGLARRNRGPLGSSVPLQEIESVTVNNDAKFSRSGDLRVRLSSGSEFSLLAIYAPEPARQTILQAVESRRRIDEALAREFAEQPSVPAAPATSRTPITTADADSSQPSHSRASKETARAKPSPRPTATPSHT